MIELIRQRYSCRQFRREALTEGQKRGLEEVCLRAPTSKNRRPWQFVFVETDVLRQQLANCKPHGAAFLAEAPLNVVIAADPALSDVWVEDCAIAASLLQLAAQSLGLGSCWCQVRLRQHQDGRPASEVVREILELPAEWEVVAIIGIGVPAETRPPVEAVPLPRDRCHRR